MGILLFLEMEGRFFLSLGVSLPFSSPQRLYLERVIREKMERKEAEKMERKQDRREKTEKGQTRTEKRDQPPPQATVPRSTENVYPYSETETPHKGGFR